MIKKSILLALMASIGLTGCASMNHEDTGTLGGAAIGGLIGSRFGSGAGQLAATGVGAMLGAFIGGNIGQTMDKQDQMRMRDALETTKTGQSTAWRNPDNGNRYRVEPTKTYYQKGRPCRQFTTVATIEGKREVVHGRACRNPRGQWQIN
jgi:surface antigen